MESFLQNVTLFFDTWIWHIVLGVSLFTFIVQGFVTSKLNKSLFGRESIVAWIPFLNMFTLGKVCADEIVGLILMVMMVLSFRLTVPINGVDKTFAILPESTWSILLPYCLFMTGCLFIYSIFKFFRLLKEKKGRA